MTIESCRSILQFAWRRFIRLWPAYVASVLIIFCGVQALDYAPFKRTVYDLLAAQVLWAPALKANYVSGVYWSLVVECRFYVLIAVLYFGLGPSRFRIGWLAMCLVATASHFIYRPVAIHIFAADYLPFFTMGLVFYRMWRRRTDGLDAVLMATAVVTLIVLWSGEGSANGKGGIAVTGMLLWMPLLFFLFVRGNLEFLAVEPLLFLGRISYSLYLIHHELTLGVIYSLVQLSMPLSVAVMTAICLTISLAALLTLGIEEPSKRALKAWGRQRPEVHVRQ